MPFVITTKRRTITLDFPKVPAGNAIVSRRAVATLTEAKAEAAAMVEHSDCEDEFFATALIPESGGSVGPLPDGTVIEVERRQWYQLAEDAGWDIHRDHWGEAELLAAYNAAQERHEGSDGH